MTAPKAKRPRKVKNGATTAEFVDAELVEPGTRGAIVRAEPAAIAPATASEVRILDRHPVDTLAGMLARPGVQAAHALAPVARFVAALLGPERKNE